MIADQIRNAIPSTPRAKLRDLAGALWKAFGAGLLDEAEAQSLAEAIEARKVIPTPAPAAPRRVGSRPRSSESMERRRRQAAGGWLPPQLASRFTLAEVAVLSVVAAEVARRGLCRLTQGHIAALAGVCRSTVKAALREARALGLLSIEEWRITAWRNAPNTVRLLSPEWTTWLRMRDRRRAKSSTPRDAEGRVVMSKPPVERGGGKFSTTTEYKLFKSGDPPRRVTHWNSMKKAG